MGFDLSVQCSIEFGAVIDDPQFLVMVRHAVKYILGENKVPNDYDIYKVEITWEDLRDWAANSPHVRTDALVPIYREDKNAIHLVYEDDVYDYNSNSDINDCFFGDDGPVMQALKKLDQSESEPRLTFEYSYGSNLFTHEDPKRSEQLRIIVNNATTNVLWERGWEHAEYFRYPWGVRTRPVESVEQGLRFAEAFGVTLEPPANMSEEEKRLATSKIHRFAEAFHLGLASDPGLMFISCVTGG